MLPSAEVPSAANTSIQDLDVRRRISNALRERRERAGHTRETIDKRTDLRNDPLVAGDIEKTGFQLALERTKERYRLRRHVHRRVGRQTAGGWIPESSTSRPLAPGLQFYLEANQQAIDDIAVSAFSEQARSKLEGVNVSGPDARDLVIHHLLEDALCKLYPAGMLLPIQRMVIPTMERTDLHVAFSAPPGSGKTLAFLLPILNHIVESNKDFYNISMNHIHGPRALILCHSRDLATQIFRDINAIIACATDELTQEPRLCEKIVPAICIGQSDRSQTADRLKSCDIVVGTIGRVADMILGGELKLSILRYLVVDEADKTLSDLYGIVENRRQEEEEQQQNKENSREVRIVNLDGTVDVLTTEEQERRKRRRAPPEMAPNATSTLITQILSRVPKTTRFVVTAATDCLQALCILGEFHKPLGFSNVVVYEAKRRFTLNQHTSRLYRVTGGFAGHLAMLLKLFRHEMRRMGVTKESKHFPSPLLVFAGRRATVTLLTTLFLEYGYPVTAISSDIDQQGVDRALADLNAGRVLAVFATNKAARGLNYHLVQHIVIYRLPTDPNEFRHQVGRVGRVGRCGMVSIFYCCDAQPPDTPAQLSYVVDYMSEQRQPVPDWAKGLCTLRTEDEPTAPFMSSNMSSNEDDEDGEPLECFDSQQQQQQRSPTMYHAPKDRLSDLDQTTTSTF